MLNIRDIGFKIAFAYRLLLANRKLLGYSVTSCLLIALVCYALQPRTYRTSLEIPIKELSSLNQSSASLTATQQEPISLLTSKNLLTSTATALDLDVKFYKQGFFRDVEVSKVNSPLEVSLLKRSATDEQFTISIIDDNTFLLTGPATTSEHDFGEPVLYGDLEFMVRKEMDFLKPGQSVLVKTKPLGLVVNGLSKSVKLMPLQPYDTRYTLYIDDKKPEYAERVLRQLILLFWQSDINVRETKAAINSIGKQLDSLNNLLVAIQKQINNTQVAATAKRQVNETDASRYRKQMAILQVLASYVNVSESQFSIVPNTFSLANKSLPPLIEQLNTLRIRRQQILAEERPNQTQLNRIRANEAEVKDSILEAVVNEDKKIENLLNDRKSLNTQLNVPDDDYLSDDERAGIHKEKQAAIKLYLSKLEKREYLKLLLRHYDSSNKPQTVTTTKIYTDLWYYIIAALFAGVMVTLILLRSARRSSAIAKYLSKFRLA